MNAHAYDINHDNTTFIGSTKNSVADYDEIEDEKHTETLSLEKHQLKANYELMAKSNYFILAEQPPQEAEEHDV